MIPDQIASTTLTRLYRLALARRRQQLAAQCREADQILKLGKNADPMGLLAIAEELEIV